MDTSPQTLRIAVVWPHRLWQTKQSPARRHYVLAVSDRDDVELTITGPGFRGWDLQQSPSENVFRDVPGCQVVWGYKLSGCEDTPCLIDDRIANECVVVENFNECWAGTVEGFPGKMHPGADTVAKECIKARMTLAILHHANDIPRLKDAADAGIKIVHIPHCADKRFFMQSVPWEKRSGIILTGVSGGVHYPLRKRWADLIRRKKIDGKIISRPSNYTRSPEESDQRVLEYADHLNRCAVKLGGSSKWRYALNHYVEAAMSGCVQVADMPELAPDGYDQMIYPVSPDASDKELIEAVERAHEQAKTLGERAREASKNFTTARYADDFVRHVRSCLK